MVAARPWWEILPTSIQEVLGRSAETPSVVPVGAVSKTIIKHTGTKLLPIVAAGGAGWLLGQISGPSQQQQASQETTVTPTQLTPMRQMLQQFLEMRQRIQTYQDTRQRATATAQADAYARAAYGEVVFRDISGGVTYAPTTVTGAQAQPMAWLDQYLDLFAGAYTSMGQVAAQKAAPVQVTTTLPALTQTQEASGSDMGLIVVAAIAALAIFGFGKK